MNTFSRTVWQRWLLLLTALVAVLATGWIHAQQAAAPAAPPGESGVLFTNVRVFTGAPTLSAPSNVLVVGNVIRTISTGAIPTEGLGRVTRIDGGGRTLMPGLIDAHWHTMFVRPTPAEMITGDFGYFTLMAGAEATATLMRGFTTVRDMGGPSFGLKQAIDAGLLPGPRIYPSGAMITTTGGHGDFRSLTELPRTGSGQSHIEQVGAAMIADNPDEVRLRAREQLAQGASQIKLMAGGGVASPHSPIDVSTFTEPELRAAVEAAENYGTYVAVHAYTSVAAQRAIAAGVKVIEHAHLIDEPTAQLMAQKGIWLSTQPFLDDEDIPRMPPGSPQYARLRQVLEGTDRIYTFAKKYKIKTVFGTDILFDAQLATRQGAQLPKLAKWFSNVEILNQATANTGEMLALSGPRNPYPGKLGVVQNGALADLLLVDGDPLKDINLVADPERNFLVIMKDGKVYKNKLAP
ncbi:amidohydrolase family protein [Ramlibacter sp. G-1-2-2]|uniref:Amidohydrolase family protein n=1 Tax=Ramlibacter agri TaxID=2728837 RepID=A0A848H0X5_9BURK|nr:amidohydrolase family protein [Ramlibacter agri]NML42403.1 amidohydrolase family protein [Ramlibacter agri]